MTRSSAIRQLDTIIGKMSHLNYQILGNQLQTALREVADVKDRLSAGQLDLKRPYRKKPVRGK